VRLVQGVHETARLALRAPAPAVAPSPPPPEPAPPPVQPPPGEEPGGSSFGRMLGFGALGLGGAGLVVGTAFVVINRSKRTDANDLCPGNVCPVASKSQIQSLDQQADNAATVAWVGYGVGGAALATGIVLLLTSGSDKNKGTSASVHPWVGVGSCGVAGEF
jgi:hypothetical protein